MSDNPIPCKDCITLAICRTRILYLKERFSPTNTSLVSHLCNKCILIHTYAYNRSVCHPFPPHFLDSELCNKAIELLTSEGECL